MTQLSPRDLASAIGVSESSVKRWVDGGELVASRTAGGHRRIERAEAVRFIRARGATVERPELLDLPPVAPRTQQPAGRVAAERLYGALVRQNAEAARSLVVSAYLGGASVAELCDGPLREALHRIGELWLDDERGIVIEHRAVDICVEALTIVRQLLPTPADEAPLAVGGAPGKDVYILPSLMVTLVLADAGFRARNLGPDTPFAVTLAAVADETPALVWQTVTVEAAARGLGPFADELAARSIPLAVGGQVFDDGRARVPEAAVRMRSMSELAGFARGLAGTPPRDSPVSP